MNGNILYFTEQKLTHIYILKSNMRMYAYVPPDSVAPLCIPKSDICHVQLECQCILSRYNVAQISVIFSCLEKKLFTGFFVRFGLFPIDLPILYAQYVMLLWIGILSIVVRIECLSFCLQEQLTATDEGFEISVIHKTRMKQFLFFSSYVCHSILLQRYLSM